MEFFRSLKKEPGKPEPPPLGADPAQGSIDDFLSKLSADDSAQGKPVPPPVQAAAVHGAAPTAEQPADLATIAQRLGLLGQVLGETNRQFLAYLAQRESAAP